MGRQLAVQALLDTHAFLWWIADSGRLSGTARSVIADESNDIVFSAASAWEISTKFRLGKLPGDEAVALDVAGHIVGQGFKELAIGVADAERAGRLPRPHRDPFDRMLAAQALARKLRFIPADPVFDGFDAIRLWRTRGPFPPLQRSKRSGHIATRCVAQPEPGNGFRLPPGSSIGLFRCDSG